MSDAELIDALRSLGADLVTEVYPLLDLIAESSALDEGDLDADRERLDIAQRAVRLAEDLGRLESVLRTVRAGERGRADRASLDPEVRAVAEQFVRERRN